MEFDLKRLEELPELVRGILANDNGEMRKRAYEKAVEKHRWVQRIEELERQLSKEN